jgi:hypothetical protein
MKKSTFRLLIVCLLFSAAFTRCKCEKDEVEPTKLATLLADKCYGLGSVTKGGTTVTSEFTGFRICFGAGATSGSITTGGTTSQTLNVTYTATGESTDLPVKGVITITGTPPTGWASSLSSVEVAAEGASLKFTVNINNPKTGAADYVFSLSKQ